MNQPFLELAKPVQAATVFFGIALCSVVAMLACFREPLNIIWMLGLPIGLAVVANRTLAWQALMAVVLLVIAFFGMIAPELMLLTYNSSFPASKIIFPCTYW